MFSSCISPGAGQKAEELQGKEIIGGALEKAAKFTSACFRTQVCKSIALKLVQVFIQESFQRPVTLTIKKFW